MVSAGAGGGGGVHCDRLARVEPRTARTLRAAPLQLVPGGGPTRSLPRLSRRPIGDRTGDVMSDGPISVSGHHVIRLSPVIWLHFYQPMHVWNDCCAFFGRHDH